MITIQDEDLKLTWTGTDKPDPAQVSPLLHKLKESKQEAISYLKSKKVQQASVDDFVAEAEKVISHLKRNGTAMIRSESLGEELLFAVDDKAAEKAKTSSSTTIYTLDELQELVKDPKLTKQRLPKIHQAKKVFNGKIIKNHNNAMLNG